jgi:putative Holliday junction resolvase
MASFSRAPAFANLSPQGGEGAPVLAIDYGRKRIGLAISDALGMTARPLETLVRANRRKDAQRLRVIAREHGVRRVIVGHPLHLDGSPSEMAAEAARFAERIRKEVGLPVELVDERLTSWEAEQMLSERKVKARTRRGATRRPVVGKTHAHGRKAVHHLAAAVLLRDYLEHKRAKIRAAEKPDEARARSAAQQAGG